MHPRTIGEPGIDERAREVDAPAEWRHEPLDEYENLLGIAEMDRRLLQSPVTPDPYALPRTPSRALGRVVAAAIALSARGSARNTSRPAIEVASDCEAMTHAPSGTSADASAAIEMGSS